MIFLHLKSSVQFLQDFSKGLLQIMRDFDCDQLFGPPITPSVILILGQANCISLFISKFLLDHYLSLQSVYPDYQYLFGKFR